MNGLTQEEVRRALSEGWSEDSLVTIHRNLKNGAFDWSHEFRGDYFLTATNPISNRTIHIYRSFDSRQVTNAFEHWEVSSRADCYCDGSGQKETVCGIGVAIYRKEHEPVLIAENIGIGTNNIAELRAIARVLKAFPNVAQDILVLTDSEYAIGALTKTWTLTANVELIARMRLDLAGRDGHVCFQHVDGHSGIEGNEVVDKLANIGRKLVTHVSPF